MVDPSLEDLTKAMEEASDEAVKADRKSWRKMAAGITAAALGGVCAYFELDQFTTACIVGPIVAYLFGQSAVDMAEKKGNK